MFAFTENTNPSTSLLPRPMIGLLASLFIVPAFVPFHHASVAHASMAHASISVGATSMLSPVPQEGAEKAGAEKAVYESQIAEDSQLTNLDANQSLQSAKKAIASGDFQSAATLLQRLRIQDVAAYRAADGYYLEGLTLYQLGRFDEAVPKFELWEVSLPNSITQLQSSTEPVVQNKQLDYANSCFMCADAYYQMALQTSNGLERSRWFQESQKHADFLASKFQGSLLGQQAQLIRAKLFMQTAMANQNVEALKELEQNFHEIAAGSEGDLNYQAVYYQAYCQQQMGQGQQAQTLLDDLRTRMPANQPLHPFVLSRLLELHMGQAVSQQTEASVADKHFEVALGLSQQLQKDYPNHDSANVAYNKAAALRGLNQFETASTSFAEVASSKAASRNLQWMATLNQARCQVGLNQLIAAQQLLDQVLDRLEFATAAQQLPAIQLAMQLGMQRQDFDQVSQLHEKFSDQIQADPAFADQADYWVALANASSGDSELRQQGLASLQQIANSDSPYAFQSKLASTEIRFDNIDRVVLSRPNFDQVQQQAFVADVATCIDDCLRLLDEESLDVSRFPVNPKVLTQQQADVLRRRMEIQSWLASCYVQNDDLEKAEAIYAELAEQNLSESQAKANWIVQYANVLSALEQHQSSIDLLKRYSNDTSLELADQLLLHNQLAKTLQLNQRWDEAAREFEYVYNNAAKGVQRDQAIVDALHAYNRSQQYSRSIRLADQVASELDGQALAIVESSRGIALVEMKRYQDALQDLDRSINRTKEVLQDEKAVVRELHDPLYFRAIALHQLKDQRAGQAWLDFAKSYPASPRVKQVASHLAQLGLKMPKISAVNPNAANPETRETSGRSTASFNEALDAAIQLGSEEKWQDAAEALATLITNAEVNESRLPEAHFQLGYSQRQLELVDEAVDTLEYLLQQFPNSSQTDRSLYYLGDLKFRQKAYGDAEQYLAKAAESENPDIRLKSLYLLGWTLCRGRQFEKAAEVFQSAGQDFGPSIYAEDAQLQWAKNLSYANDAEAAYDAFTKIVKQRTADGWSSDQQQMDVRILAGKAALVTEHYSEAKDLLSMQDFLQQSQLQPTDAQAQQILYQLALAHKGLGEDQSANAIFEELAKSPTAYGAQALDALASAAKQEGDTLRASVRYRSLANGAYGSEPSLIISQLQANAKLQVGLLYADMASKARTLIDKDAKRNEAKSWLKQAQEQTFSRDIADQATAAISRL